MAETEVLELKISWDVDKVIVHTRQPPKNIFFSRTGDCPRI
jgi:hypothetical protein